MSVVSTPAASLSPFTPPMRRFTVNEYHQMIQAGILTENDPVELVEGFVVYKKPHNPLHDGTIELAEEALRTRLPAGWRVRIQSAITTGDSEPEPDLAVVAGTAASYLQRHPGPSDIALVVEVADSSLHFDRTDKARTYARAGIVCYWIINLVDEQVEVRTDPTGPAVNPVYRQRQDYRTGDSIPLVINGQEVGRIPASELLR